MSHSFGQQWNNRDPKEKARKAAMQQVRMDHPDFGPVTIGKINQWEFAGLGGTTPFSTDELEHMVSTVFDGAPEKIAQRKGIFAARVQAAWEANQEEDRNPLSNRSPEARSKAGTLFKALQTRPGMRAELDAYIDHFTDKTVEAITQVRDQAAGRGPAR